MLSTFKGAPPVIELLQALSKGWTPGAVGIWLILATLLLGLWKGLPGVLDSWSNRIDKERQHREREIARLEGQIKASDDRHEECLAGQDALRVEIDNMRKAHASEISEMRQNHADEMEKVRNLATGLMMQIRQFQLSGATMAPDLPSEYTAMLKAIDRGQQ